MSSNQKLIARPNFSLEEKLSKDQLQFRRNYIDRWSTVLYPIIKASELNLNLQVALDDPQGIEALRDYLPYLLIQDLVQFRKALFKQVFENFEPEPILESLIISCCVCKKSMYTAIGKMHEYCSKKDFHTSTARIGYSCNTCGHHHDSKFDQRVVTTILDNDNFGMPRSILLTDGSWIAFCSEKNECLAPLIEMGKVLSPFYEHLSYCTGSYSTLLQLKKAIQNDTCECCRGKRDNYVMPLETFMQDYRTKTSNIQFLLALLSLCKDCHINKAKMEYVPQESMIRYDFDRIQQAILYITMDSQTLDQMKERQKEFGKPVTHYPENNNNITTIMHACITCRKVTSKEGIRRICYGPLCQGLNDVLLENTDSSYEICRYCSTRDYGPEYLPINRSPICLACYQYCSENLIGGDKNVYVCKLQTKYQRGNSDTISLFDRTQLTKEQESDSKLMEKIVKENTRKVIYVDNFNGLQKPSEETQITQKKMKIEH